MSDQAMARPICEHYFHYHHQPGLPKAVSSVGICQLCGDVNAADITRQIKERFEKALANDDLSPVMVYFARKGGVVIHKSNVQGHGELHQPSDQFVADYKRALNDVLDYLIGE